MCAGVGQRRGDPAPTAPSPRQRLQGKATTLEPENWGMDSTIRDHVCQYARDPPNSPIHVLEACGKPQTEPAVRGPSENQLQAPQPEAGMQTPPGRLSLALIVH